MYYVYSIKCKNGFYIGCTDNIEERLSRHKNGYVPATTNRLPVELEFYVAFTDKYKAFSFEKYLKSGSGRAFTKKHIL
ncbi:MAG: GIY-YIG nuclease family protein [Parcubacteria group bacterium]